MSTQVSDDVLSNQFTVYSAKNFPGMTGNREEHISNLERMLMLYSDSTLISQCFAQQGIKISIRKGRRIRRVVDTFTNNPLDDANSDTEKEDQSNIIANDQSSSSSPPSSATTIVKPHYRRIHISTFLSPP
jgi:hypothetical protein